MLWPRHRWLAGAGAVKTWALVVGGRIKGEVEWAGRGGVEPCESCLEPPRSNCLLLASCPFVRASLKASLAVGWCLADVAVSVGRRRGAGG